MNTNRIVLEGISEQILGLKWESDRLLRIGRQRSNEVVVDNASLSSCHTEIRHLPRGWFVKDLGAGTGTMVNGIALDEKLRRLEVGDVVQSGKAAFRVTVLERAAAAPPPRRGPSSIKTSGPVVLLKAANHASWEQGLHNLAKEDRALQGNQLLTLLRAGYHLSLVESLPELLKTILEDVVAVMDAQRGSIVIVDEGSGELVLRCVVADPNLPGKPFSNTLTKRCLDTGESLLCDGESGDAKVSGASAVGSMICALLRSPRRRLGVLHLDRSPSQPPFGDQDLSVADAVAAGIAVGVESAQLLENQKQQTMRSIAAFAMRAVELRRPEAAERVERARQRAALLAEELELEREERLHLETAAVLHDIDATLLDACGAAGIALAETVPGLEPVAPILRSYRERWDGAGRQDGRGRQTIPRLARALAVVAAFCAACHESGCDAPEKAFRRLEDGAGTLFDPECVEAFLQIRPRIDKLSAGQAAEPASVEC